MLKSPIVPLKFITRIGVWFSASGEPACCTTYWILLFFDRYEGGPLSENCLWDEGLLACADIIEVAWKCRFLLSGLIVILLALFSSIVLCMACSCKYSALLCSPAEGKWRLKKLIYLRERSPTKLAYSTSVRLRIRIRLLSYLRPSRAGCLPFLTGFTVTCLSAICSSTL